MQRCQPNEIQKINVSGAWCLVILYWLPGPGDQKSHGSGSAHVTSNLQKRESVLCSII